MAPSKRSQLETLNTPMASISWYQSPAYKTKSLKHKNHGKNWDRLQVLERVSWCLAMELSGFTVSMTAERE